MTDRRTPNWLTQWEYAHRGLHSPGVPENSLAAAEAAITAGMGIECDIQRSRDDVPMVFHDWELARLTDGSGLTEVHSAPEIEALHLQETDERPPSLVTFLNEIAGKVPLLIEIKSRPDYDVETSCEAVAAALVGYSAKHAVMSFDPRVGEWFATNSPDTPRGLVCTDTLDMGFLSAWRAAGALEAAQSDFLAVDIRDLPNSIASLWRESGRPLLAWTARNAELRVQAMVHADALISEGDGLA